MVQCLISPPWETTRFWGPYFDAFWAVSIEGFYCICCLRQLVETSRGGLYREVLLYRLINIHKWSSVLVSKERVPLYNISYFDRASNYTQFSVTFTLTLNLSGMFIGENEVKVSLIGTHGHWKKITLPWREEKNWTHRYSRTCYNMHLH